VITRRAFLTTLLATLLPTRGPLFIGEDCRFIAPTHPLTLTQRKVMGKIYVSEGLLAADWINDSTYCTPYLGIDRSQYSR